jgi:NADH-quinone oxidoreductase subunit M
VAFACLPSVELTRSLSVAMSGFLFLIGCCIVLDFDKAGPAFQFVGTYPVFFEYNIVFAFGLDGLSLVFLILTLFVFPFCFLSATTVDYYSRWYFVLLFSMEVLLLLTFSVLDLFYFYIFFESLLIPLFIMIGMWGSRARRVKAAYYFFLFAIFYVYTLFGTTSYFVLINSSISVSEQRVLWACFLLAFAVKMPLFPFHIWLPEAHVEAPTVGSILLASLLLKLGGYGLFRCTLSIVGGANGLYSPVVMFLGALGVLYGSLVTIRQADLKRVIAYSSVAHMNLTCLGIFSNCTAAIDGAIFMMLAHGVVSSALFFCVGVLYDRHHSRIFQYYSGFVLVMPVFSGLFLLFTLANMSFPGTANFVGEFLIFCGLAAYNPLALIFGASGIVLSAVYSIWVYNRVIFGTLWIRVVTRYLDVHLVENWILSLCGAVTFYMGIFAAPVLGYFQEYVFSLRAKPSAAELAANKKFWCDKFIITNMQTKHNKLSDEETLELAKALYDRMSTSPVGLQKMRLFNAPFEQLPGKPSAEKIEVEETQAEASLLAVYWVGLSAVILFPGHYPFDFLYGRSLFESVIIVIQEWLSGGQ